MFPAERATVLFNKPGHIQGNVMENLNVLGILQVKNRTKVKFSHGNMGMVNTIETVTIQYFIKIFDVVFQNFHIHTGIFNNRDRSSISGYIGQNTKACFSQSPYLGDISSFHNRVMISKPLLLHIRDHNADPFIQFCGILIHQFHHQNCSGITIQEEAIFPLRMVFLGTVKNGLIHQLYCGGFVPKRNQVPPDSLHNRLEMNGYKGPVRWRYRKKIQPGLCHKKQCTFRTGNKATQVIIRILSFLSHERRTVQEFIQGISRIPPHYTGIRKMLENFLLIIRIQEYFMDSTVNITFHSLPFKLLFQDLRGQGAEFST